MLTLIKLHLMLPLILLLRQLLEPLSTLTALTMTLAIRIHTIERLRPPHSPWFTQMLPCTPPQPLPRPLLHTPPNIPAYLRLCQLPCVLV